MSSKNAKVKAISTDQRQLTVWLEDGRILALPLAWYPSLAEASPAERAIWQPCGAGGGIHWPALDYDLSLEGLLDGRREHHNALRHTRQTRAKNHALRKGPPRSRTKKSLGGLVLV
jgi:hypothetical protein